MQLNSMTDEKQRVTEFADWILNVGDGTNTRAEGGELIKNTK